MTERDEKKSESLEVRLPYSQKIAFMDACREEGITASEALRAGIDEFLASREGQSQQSNQFRDVVTLMKTNPKKTAGSLMALSLGAALFTAMPSAAQDELFVQYDKNKDGVLTVGEISENDGKVFEVLDKNGDGQITADEFEREAEVTQTMDAIEQDEDGNDVRVITFEQTKIMLGEEGKAHVMVSRWAESVDLDATDEEVAARIEEMKSNTHELGDGPDMEHIIGLGDGDHDSKDVRIIIKKGDGEDISDAELSDILKNVEITQDMKTEDGRHIIIKRVDVHSEHDTTLEDGTMEEIEKFLAEEGLDGEDGKKVVIHKKIIRKDAEE